MSSAGHAPAGMGTPTPPPAGAGSARDAGLWHPCPPRAGRRRRPAAAAAALAAAAVMLAALGVLGVLGGQLEAGGGARGGEGLDGAPQAVDGRGGASAVAASTAAPTAAEPTEPRPTALPTRPSKTMPPTALPTRPLKTMQEPLLRPTSAPTWPIPPPHPIPPLSDFAFERFSPPDDAAVEAQPWGRMIRSLRGSRVLVLQSDDRLADVLSPSQGPPPRKDFLNEYYAVSAVAMQRWTLEQNASYAFFSSPGRCVGPALGQEVAPYWCKVPAILYGLRVAAAARVPYLLFLDSDVIPGDPRLTINNTMTHWLDSNPSKHVALVPDLDYYAGVIRGKRIYGSEPINSGIIGMRVSNETWRLVWRWWFELTQLPTLMELRTSELEMHFSLAPTAAGKAAARAAEKAKRGGAKAAAGKAGKAAAEADEEGEGEGDGGAGPFLVQYVAQNATEALLEEAFPRKTAAAYVTQFGVQGNEAFVVVEPSPLSREFNDSAFWREAVPRCCEGGACLRALRARSGARLKCEVTHKSTMWAWPGDQDRLNWLLSLERPHFYITAALARGCSKLPTTRQRHRTVPDNQLVMHVCDTGFTKHFFGARQGLTEMRLARFMAPETEPTAANLTAAALDERTAKWREAGGWAHLRSTLRFFALPRRAAAWTVDEVLRGVMDRGDVVLGTAGWGP